MRTALLLCLLLALGGCREQASDQLHEHFELLQSDMERLASDYNRTLDMLIACEKQTSSAREIEHAHRALADAREEFKLEDEGDATLFDPVADSVLCPGPDCYGVGGDPETPFGESNEARMVSVLEALLIELRSMKALMQERLPGPRLLEMPPKLCDNCAEWNEK